MRISDWIQTCALPILERSGAPEHIGILVALKDRQNALKNPYAHLHEHDISFDSIKDSMMLWDPIRYAETCPSSDGACALVLASAAVADRAEKPPAWGGGDRKRGVEGKSGGVRGDPGGRSS